ncbi:MAG: hypothetical protein ACRD8Z_24630 [Nitrososphaeraceae archaeon]
MADSRSIMNQNEETQPNPKIEVQYTGDESFMADSIRLEFVNDRRIFLIEYDDISGRLVAHFLNQNPKTNENTQESEHCALEKKDYESGNMRFKIVIGQSMWRFQRIKKQIEITEIKGIIRKLSSDQIVYEYAAPLAELSKIEILNRLDN